MIDDSSGIEQEILSPHYKKFSVIVNGLRMATNYSFEVRPMESRRIRYYMDSKMLSRRIIVPTKGCKVHVNKYLILFLSRNN